MIKTLPRWAEQAMLHRGRERRGSNDERSRCVKDTASMDREHS